MKIVTTLITAVLLLAGCQVTPASQLHSSDEASHLRDSAYIALATRTEKDSLPAIIFDALEMYSDSEVGQKTVIFGSRDTYSTELSVIVGKDQVHCQRYLSGAGNEYSCQMTQLTFESETVNSLPALLLAALEAFADTPGTAGYENIIFGARDTYATELSFYGNDEGIDCSRYVVNETEEFSCTLSVK